MTQATVTIVTVCKNSVATISKTITSVLEQKHRDLEYIIIDGASSDGTQDIIKSFGSSVDVFICEPDAGIADAFNKGVLRASGAIVGLINADDCLLSGVVDRVNNFFATHPEVDILHGDVLLYEGSRFIKKIQPAGRWWFPWRFVLFNHPATFVRKRVYEEYGLFDTSYRIAMDVEIFLRWVRKDLNIVYLPDALVAMQAGGLSGRSAFQGYREAKRACFTYRFSPLLVNIQYVARCGVQYVDIVQKKLRMFFARVI